MHDLNLKQFFAYIQLEQHNISFYAANISINFNLLIVIFIFI